jgi:hypothetical protein
MSEKTSNIQARGTDRGKLEERVAMWPTPMHTDHLMNKSETLEAWTIRAKKKKEENGVNLQYALRHAVQEQKPGGTLNPTWVEWLMGYPTGHTDLNR